MERVDRKSLWETWSEICECFWLQQIAWGQIPRSEPIDCSFTIPSYTDVGAEEVNKDSDKHTEVVINRVGICDWEDPTVLQEFVSYNGEKKAVINRGTINKDRKQ